MEPMPITREEAHELVEEAHMGILVTAEPVPVIGKPESYKVRLEAFQIGEGPPEDVDVDPEV